MIFKYKKKLIEKQIDPNDTKLNKRAYYNSRQIHEKNKFEEINTNNSENVIPNLDIEKMVHIIIIKFINHFFLL